MRLLLTALTYPPATDGVATVVSMHARFFVAGGHEVVVATAGREGEPPEVDANGARVFRFDVSGSGNVLRRYRGEVRRYREFIEEFRCDAMFLHAWQAWTTDLAMSANVQPSVKRVIVSHGVSANSRAGWPRSLHVWLGWRPYVRRCLPRMLRAADRVVYLAQCEDEDRFYDCRVARSLNLGNGIVIPNGGEATPSATGGPDFRAKHGLDGVLLILCVGKFDSMKNEAGVIEAVLRSSICDAVVVLIGPRRNAYTMAIERTWTRRQDPRRQARLIILEQCERDEIRSAYAAADIFVTASRTECQPLVILDAMAAGVPFVSTDVGCVRMLPGGLVVRDVGGMASALSKLARDEDLRESLGYAGRTAARREYNWSAIGEAYERLLRGMAT